jgi:hypothetical protein
MISIRVPEYYKSGTPRETRSARSRVSRRVPVLQKRHPRKYITLIISDTHYNSESNNLHLLLYTIIQYPYFIHNIHSLYYVY